MKTVKQLCFRFGPYLQIGVVVAVGLAGFALAPYSYAQQPPPPTGVNGAVPQITLSGPNDINTKILCPVFNLMFWVLLTISIIMVLWAGFQYATAGDDTEKTSSARKTITYAAIGVVVALIAKGFPALVGSLFGAGSAEGVGACSGI